MSNTNPLLFQVFRHIRRYRTSFYLCALLHYTICIGGRLRCPLFLGGGILPKEWIPYVGSDGRVSLGNCCVV
jgi:hypothetical protein